MLNVDITTVVFCEQFSVKEDEYKKEPVLFSVNSSHLDYLSFNSERRQEQKVDQDGDQAVKETWSSKLLKYLRFISQV